ncbi:hypothetical protein F5Y19DRAFT_388835 [Xylariaceae sp. FL1651]|nr:hypothetical protein F5Y19DRAFT_388835 [Xylariaceae sp. FL1651]
METHALPPPGLVTFTTPLDWLSRFTGISYFVPLPPSHFEPDPTAPFEEEFRRFAAALNMDLREWRVQRTRAIDLELVYHYFSAEPAVVDGQMLLKGYQNMLQAMGLEPKATAAECWHDLVYIPVDVVALIDFKRTGQQPTAPKLGYPEAIDSVATPVDYPEARAGSGMLSTIHPKLVGQWPTRFRFKKGMQVLPPWWNEECRSAKVTRSRARKHEDDDSQRKEHEFKAAVRRAKRAYNTLYGETFRL